MSEPTPAEVDKHSVYHHIQDAFHERTIEGLPPEEWRDATCDALWATSEFLMPRILDAVQTVAACEGAMTYKDLGELLYWAENVRLAVESLSEEIEKIRIAAHESEFLDESPREPVVVVDA